MNKVYLLLLLIFIGIKTNSIQAQEHSKHTPSHLTHKNDIAGFIGGTYLLESGFFLPTFGIEYVRKISPHFGIGAIAEIEVGSHIVSKDEHSQETVEVDRESALLLLPALYFKAGNLVASVGYGVEFEKSENLGLFKVGLMYIIRFKNENWSFVPSVSWDHTIHFDGLVYGISIARGF